MEIFCYDLMLAERWAAKRPGSITLIHDSNLFADVDDRQIAAALELAAKKAGEMSFQYICTFNSDKLPQSEFSKGFDIADYTRMRLTDETDEGGLLGMRLPSAATRAPKSSSRKLVSTKPSPTTAAAVVATDDDDVDEEVEEEEPNLFNQANVGPQKVRNRS